MLLIGIKLLVFKLAYSLLYLKLKANLFIMEVARGGMGVSHKATENALRKNPHDLFELSRLNTTYVGRTEVVFYADNLNDKQGSPQRILVIANSKHYLDMSKARLRYVLKLCKSNGDPVPKWHDMSVVPLPASSLWKTVNVQINNVDEPALSQDLYAQKVYCETVLSYSTGACLSSIAGRYPVFDNPGFYNDTLAFKNFESNTRSNAAGVAEAAKKSYVPKEIRKFPFWARNSMFIDHPNGVEIITPLHLDIFQNEAYIPPNTNIGLKFNRNPSGWATISLEPNETYELKIAEMSLSVPFIELDPAIHIAHEKMFASGKQAMFLFEKIVPLTRQFSSNESVLNFHQLSQGTLPKQAFVMMFNTEDFDGKASTSPYNMQHNNATEVTWKIDNQIVYPVVTTDFDDGTNLGAHEENMKNLGIHGNQDILLSEAAFNTGGYTMWIKDFSPDGCAGYHLHDPARLGNRGQGTLDLSIKLKTGLTAATTLLVFLAYDRIMFLDRYRNVTFQTI